MPAPSEHVHVVGMGNLLYRDEGIGVYAARYLLAAYRFSPEIDVIDGATLGFGLMELFAGGAKIIVLDALVTEAQAGTIYRLGQEQLLGLGPSMRPTAHEVEPLELLKLAAVLGEPPEMVLIGIVPADARTMGVGLTPQLEAAFPHYVDAALSEIGAGGVHAELVRNLSFAAVLESLVTHA